MNVFATNEPADIVATVDLGFIVNTVDIADTVDLVDTVDIVDVVNMLDIVATADIVGIVDIGECAEYTRPFRRIHSVPVRHYCSPCAVNG